MMVRQNQRGVALITVLFVVALISMISVTMTGRLQLQLRRTQSVVANEQAYWINLGAETLAQYVLKQDRDDSDNSMHMGQYWASGSMTFPVEVGTLVGEITDLRGCFNLNALGTATKDANTSSDRTLQQSQFIALLESLEIESYQAEAMADALRDWIDADDMVSGSAGAEDSDYAGLRFPYLPANSLMVSMGELRAVQGFTIQAVEALQEAACVVPGDANMKVNVNTVRDPKVFVALFTPRMEEDTANELISNRPDNGWETIDEFMGESVLVGLSLQDSVKQQLSVDSDTFRLQVATEIGLETLQLTSILRESEQGDWKVISREFGGQG